MDHEQIRAMAGVAMRVMVAAADRDDDTISELMGQTATEHGTSGVYSLCCAFAETVMRLGFGVDRQGAGLAGITLFGPGGRRIAPEDADPAARPGIWATRFVAAYVNDDGDMTVSLFNVSVDRGWESHTADVSALIQLVGQVVRGAERRRKASES